MTATTHYSYIGSMADRSREDGPDWRNTPRYLRLRRLVLAEQPLCLLCQERGIEGMVATELDHIEPVAAGGDRWNRANLRGLCVDCHREKSDQELQALRNPASVTCLHGTVSAVDCPDCQAEIEVAQ